MSIRNFGIHFLNTQKNTTLIIPHCREKLEVQYLAYLKREVAYKIRNRINYLFCSYLYKSLNIWLLRQRIM